MNAKRGLKSPILLLVLYLCVLTIPCSSSFFRKQPVKIGSSVIFPVTGNVYPKGYYYVTINVGQPARPYFFDIDTGSDLTWLQCDAPCSQCTPAPHKLYKPHNNLIMCQDSRCAALHGPGSSTCESAQDQCDYEIEYADHGSTMGVLVNDLFPLQFTNGSTFSPRLTFGCGYNQEVPDSYNAAYTDGVLGLGRGKSSIVAQLYDLKLSRDMVGHCLSSTGGGFLFIGDDLLPSSGIVWAPMSQKFAGKHYSLGSADLLFGGQKTGIQGVQIIFDSGSTYSYFSSITYNALLSLIKKDLNGELMKDAKDKSLPVCWKGPKPFKSVVDAKSFFKPLVLSFLSGKNVLFHLQPEAYLIATANGNICLGIMNGGEVGLGNINVIGDISMQNKMVIYDYEKQKIGWVPANCDKLPNVDDYSERDYQPYTTKMGILEECPIVGPR